MPEKPKRTAQYDPNLALIDTPALLRAFNIHPETLAINREGVMSSQQASNLIQIQTQDGASNQLMLSILLGTSILLALIFIMQGYPMLPLVIGIALMIAPLAWMVYQRRQRLEQDIERRRIYHIDGIPTMTHHIGKEESEMQIDGQRLTITRAQAQMLSGYNLPMMRVYYSAQTRQVIAAEVLPHAMAEKLKNDDLQDDDALMNSARQWDDPMDSSASDR